MKKNKWFVTAALAAMLVMSGPTFADNGEDMDGKGGMMMQQQTGCGEHKIPEAKFKLFHEAMKSSFEKDKALHEKAHKLHGELRRVLEAQTFDKKSFLQLNARLHGIQMRMHRHETEAFASIAGQFTPDERKQFMMMLHEHDEHKHEHMMHGDMGHGHMGMNGQHEGYDEDRAREGWEHHHQGQSGEAQQGGEMQPQQAQPAAPMNIMPSTEQQPIRDMDYPPYSPR
jgi:hypothetical protein